MAEKKVRAISFVETVRSLEKHVYKGQFMASDGQVQEYMDICAMIMDNPEQWKLYFERRVGKLGIVGSGRSGAFLVGLLGRGMWYNQGKKYGLEWNGTIYPKGTQVALVDDIWVTGGTMFRLAEEAKKKGLLVRKIVVAWPWLYVNETSAERLNEVADAARVSRASDR